MKKAKRRLRRTRVTAGMGGPVRLAEGDAFVELTKGLEARISAEDVELVAPHFWQASSSVQHPYAFRMDPERGTVSMHREILGAQMCEKVDHINGDTLDNRRENLRVCSVAMNSWNRHVKYPRRGRPDAPTGVYYAPETSKSKPWRAYANFNGKRVHLGLHETVEQAARARAVFLAENIPAEFLGPIYKND